MDKNKLGFIFFIIALCFLSSPSFTGNVIGGNYYFNPTFFIGFVFLIISFVIFVSRQRLDAILIPTSPSYEKDMERADAAAKEYLQGKGANYLIISGAIGEKKLSESQRKKIYDRLRNYRIQPSELRIEGESKNTLENLLNSLKKVKKHGAKRIGIASNPSHLDRYEDILRVAKREGIVDKDFKIYRIETSENFADKVYGFFSRLFYRYKLGRGIEKAKKRETPGWVKGLTNFFYRLIGKK